MARSNAPIAPSMAATARTATITGKAPLGANQSVGVWVQFNSQAMGIPPTLCTVNGATCG